jgi:hypothetical protein
MPEAATAQGTGVALWAHVKKRWRAWLRALHRDLGYLTVGLTIIYAVSGLALNHIGQWDPNFTTVHRELTIQKIPADVADDVAIARAAKAIGLPDEAVASAARYGDEIHFDEPGGTVVVYGDSGLVVEDARQSRFFLRLANWLHEVRGKPQWRYIADAYASILLFLAIGGLFMIKGRLGLKWRGSALVLAGAMVPVLYVTTCGGPGAKPDAAPAATAVKDEAPAPPPDRAAPAPAAAPGSASAPAPAPASDDDKAPPSERMQPRVPMHPATGGSR